MVSSGTSPGTSSDRDGARRGGAEVDVPPPAYRALRSPAGLTLEEGLDQLADAIRDPTRRRILVTFYRDPAGRTAAEVASAAGISRPVARTHLEVLRAAGFLQLARRRGRPGKPAHVYTLDTNSPQWMPHPPRQMSLLAMLVLEAASLGPDRVIPLVEQVGYDFGQAVRDMEPAPPASVDEALAPLRRLGERVSISSGDGRRAAGEMRVEIGDALFRDACPDRPDLVAHLHVGVVAALVEGMSIEVMLGEAREAPADEAPAGEARAGEPPDAGATVLRLRRAVRPSRAATA